MRIPLVSRFTKDQLIDIVNKATYIKDLFDLLDLPYNGNNYNCIKKTLRDYGIDYTRLSQNSANRNIFNLRNHAKRQSLPYNQILVENSTITSRRALKLRLLKDGLLQNKCYDCGQMPEWNNKSLSLQIDHKNGVSTDNRLENLQILCPNCHSQTETFGSKRFKKPKPLCLDCKKEISFNCPSGLCLKCYKKLHNIVYSKHNKPNKEQLIELMQTMTAFDISLKYGVSASTVRKWIREYGLKLEDSPMFKKNSRPQILTAE